MRAPTLDLRTLWRRGSGARALVGLFAAYLTLQLVFGRLELGGVGIGLKNDPIPFGIFVNGAVIGSLYGLVAMGVILVYRANRIINFAAGAMGAVPATVALLLINRRGLPYGVALAIVIGGSLLVGAFVEVAFIRRFQRSSRLVLTVVTLGVSQVLLFLEVISTVLITGQAFALNSFPTPFGDIRFNVGIVNFSGDHVLAVVVVFVVTLALGAFIRFTDIGVGVRAAAENSDRAALLGIPVRRLSTIIWALASVLSGMAIFLRAPLVGLPLGGFVSPAFLLFALTAAVIGRMEKLPIAFVAGMALGMVDQATFFSTRQSSLTSAVVLVVILVTLAVQRRATDRAQDTGVGSWQLVEEFRPVPRELRYVPEVMWFRVATWGIVAVLALTAPIPFNCGSEGGCLPTLILIYAAVGVSLVVLTGWAGQISLGQFAIVGVGSAVAGGLVVNLNLDFFVVVLAAGLAGGVVATVLGLPAIRMQGTFLAVTTLAFTFTVQGVLLNPEYFGWLLPGDYEFVERPLLYGRFPTQSPIAFYYVTLATLGVIMLMAKALRRNRSGRLFIGVRDNERGMQASAVNVARTRLAAFALSGFIAGVAGALFAYHQGVVLPGLYSPAQSLQLFVMAVIGGITSLSGAVLGAVFVYALPNLPGLNRIEFVSFLTSGIGLLVLLLYFPGGLGQVAHGIRDSMLRWVANRRGIHVPSLVADSRQEASVEGPEIGEEVVDEALTATTGLDGLPGVVVDHGPVDGNGHRHAVAAGASASTQRRTESGE